MQPGDEVEWVDPDQVEYYHPDSSPFPGWPDKPAEWNCRPDHLAPHRCACGARFHVRRHLEAHTTTCPERTC